MKKDKLGDQMKALERLSGGALLRPDLPVYLRLDGRSFSSFTRTMKRPFDAGMTRLMVTTAAHMALETSALAAYVQSDEISLLWHWRRDASPDGQALFGGKPHKLASVFASMATARFMACLADPAFKMTDYLDKLPHFDGRVVQMPDEETAAAMFAWRGADARRNAISQIAQSVFSHKSLQGKSTRDMIAMLAENGTPVEAFPGLNRFGTLCYPRKELVTLSKDVLARIPERMRPEGGVGERSVLKHFTDASPDRLVNLQAVLFGDEAPEIFVHDMQTTPLS